MKFPVRIFRRFDILKNDKIRRYAIPRPAFNRNAVASFFAFIKPSEYEMIGFDRREMNLTFYPMAEAFKSFSDILQFFNQSIFILSGRIKIIGINLNKTKKQLHIISGE